MVVMFSRVTVSHYTIQPATVTSSSGTCPASVSRDWRSTSPCLLY